MATSLEHFKKGLLTLMWGGTQICPGLPALMATRHLLLQKQPDFGSQEQGRASPFSLGASLRGSWRRNRAGRGGPLPLLPPIAFEQTPTDGPRDDNSRQS